MNNRTEAKLTDLSGMQKAIEEILKQAWERGRKYGKNEDRPQGELILSLTELCNRYCKNCPITDVPNECTDCICTHIRGIMKGGAE